MNTSKRVAEILSGLTSIIGIQTTQVGWERVHSHGLDSHHPSVRA